MVLLDLPRNSPGLTREIPVEVVTEPIVPEKNSPEVAGGDEKSTRPREAAPPRLESPNDAGQQRFRIDEGAKPGNQPHPGVSSGANPAAPSAPGGLGALIKPRHENLADRETRLGVAAHMASQIGRPGNRTARAFLPFALQPERFRAVAMPLPAGNGGEGMSYSFIVGGILKRVIKKPESARKRGAKGTATVRFVLDQSGGVASAVLLRSSGETDLDAESVAVINRAAPFPPPPIAKHSFVIEVAFGKGN
jgi:periplasmic protein TonB